ncbi:MAG: HD domain-containing protein [Gemmiger sp.]|nr:HD domain-containing protein [Gemmiger sp.]
MFGLFKPKSEAPNVAARGTPLAAPSATPAPQAPQAPQAPAAPAPPPAVSPSPRLLQALAGLYRVILSVELRSGVYQLEGGSLNFLGEAPPVRGYYDALYTQLAACIAPGGLAAFEALFARKNLYSRLAGGATSAQGEFCLARPTPDPAATDFAWYQWEALRLSATADGAVRCLLFARPVKNADDDGRPALPPPQIDPNNPGDTATPAWERLRTQKLLGGHATLFFEYAPATDTMTVHRASGDPSKDRTVPHYLLTLAERCDWTIFHEDVPAVKKLLKSGSGHVELRYRAGGDYKMPFRWHRMQCAPLEDKGTDTNTGTPTLILGALTDIEEEVALRDANRSMSDQIGALIEATYAEIYEIDTQRGTMARVTSSDGVYRRAAPQPLAATLRAAAARGDIHPCSRAEYENWLKPGYLERVAAHGGRYTFEGCTRRPGNPDYRWFVESITCPDARLPHRFLRLSRDVTEVRLQRQRNLALQERARFEDYNQAMLDTLATVVEFRDVESGQHIRRVRELTVILLRDLAQNNPEYAKTPEEIATIGVAATMHDVGKITISDAILNKPGRFDEGEFEMMKTHTTAGAKIIDHLKLTESEALKACCRDIALHHHERYDGGGYPEGLVGDANTIAAQVVGLVDAYDALVSDRCYKQAYPHAEALHMLQTGACGAFNPQLLLSLQNCAGKLRTLYTE